MMFTGDTMTDDPTTALVHALVQARNEQATIAAVPWAATLSRIDQAYAVQDGVARRSAGSTPRRRATGSRAGRRATRR
jgi:2-keto-4-pentenoate hydratase